MEKEGVLKDYAICGEVATIYYTEPFSTQDLDIFFIPKIQNNIILMAPFYDFF